ncbi:MAG TPA: dienelactone hydrolase family protein [Ferruginibacter sp.]|jgi:dienelactone hydrolase|nr:dienelactone hydrolase family protein [Ferruginibacter sp.]
MKRIRSYCTVLISVILFSCNNSSENKKTETKMPNLQEDNISYKIDSLTMDGYIVYDKNIEGKRPAVLVVHEWWGLNDYTKRRARELAQLGYIAMAVDMYGNGKRADNPTDAGNLATPFYKDPAMTKKHFDAAVSKLKEYKEVDTANMAGIGYCFGGGVLLNIARMGEGLKGVVSFHGSLVGTPANKDLLKSKILVCHGADDKFVPETEVAEFKKQMDSIGAAYTFRSYPGATHAFTNPDATAIGQKYNIPIAYNAAADTASWNEMKTFFSGLFK